MTPKKIFHLGLLSALLGGLPGCEKLIDAPPPPSSIPQHRVFATEQEAISALSGAYYNMVNSNVPTLLNGGLTIYTALAGDELILFDAGNPVAIQFYQNNLQSTNTVIGTNLWAAPYQVNYQFNAIIEGVEASTGIPEAIRKNILCQALFGRALIHYHLCSIFDAVPWIARTDWRTTGLLERTPVLQVYANIIADLKNALEWLPEEYSLIKGGRLVANKWAATVLLAKVYAATKDWKEVARLCDQVINSGAYRLADSPREVFALHSPEAILQLQQDPTAYSFNATREGMTLLPIDGIFPFPPFAYLSPSLLQAFEQEDLRKSQWIRSREIEGKTLYYPYKYQVGPSQAEPGAPLTEGYMIFRLGEVLLLRAEARAMQGQTAGAVEDLNMIRKRAGLLPLTPSLTQEEVMQAVEQENRTELFCEWGHRWADLKKRKNAAQIIGEHKRFSVSSEDLLFPIPASELLINPNLVQNPGY